MHGPRGPRITQTAMRVPKRRKLANKASHFPPPEDAMTCFIVRSHLRRSFDSFLKSKKNRQRYALKAAYGLAALPCADSLLDQPRANVLVRSHYGTSNNCATLAAASYSLYIKLIECDG